MLLARGPILTLLAIITLALAGCVNTPKDDSGANPPPTSGANPNGGALPSTISPIPQLTTSVKLDAPSWVEPGATVLVSATPPPGATPPLSWTWATGQLSGTAATAGAPLNTSLIQPGSTQTLTFTQPGLYNMHCHPHPFMRSNVTVVDGFRGPTTVDVQIVDGASVGEYRFVPENIIIAPGTKVTYHDAGTLPHTATELQRTPVLTKANLDAPSGPVKLPASIPMPGMDMQMAPEWTNVVAIVKDADGRVGIANASIYVNSYPAPYNATISGNFPAGGLPDSAVAPETKSIMLEAPGTLYLNFTATDAAAEANPTIPNTATIDIHVRASGETTDLASATDKASGALQARVQEGSYTVTITPKSGANVDYKAYVTVVYDLIPPPPTLMSMGGSEHAGHGG